LLRARPAGAGLWYLAAGRPPADSTIFHLASITKQFASTVLMALVEEGRISLDDPVSNYGVTLPGPGVILVRHLLSHTSEGVPGTSFRYNGDRFALLDAVIARGAGMPFAEALQARIAKGYAPAGGGYIPTAWGAGALESSPWAWEFLDAFVLGTAPLPGAGPAIER
jgi:CubicO group peptidase (beta-lactamase class C family)